jgi:hypothetical protein
MMICLIMMLMTNDDGDIMTMIVTMMTMSDDE